jgi:hypothetical protein
MAASILHAPRAATFVRGSPQLLQELQRLTGYPDHPTSPAIAALMDELHTALVVDAAIAPTYLAMAQQNFATTEIAIDGDAPLARADGGVWVGAWVFVPEPPT